MVDISKYIRLSTIVTSRHHDAQSYDNIRVYLYFNEIIVVDRKYKKQ